MINMQAAGYNHTAVHQQQQVLVLTGCVYAIGIIMPPSSKTPLLGTAAELTVSAQQKCGTLPKHSARA
jgi:hypothetical protein